MASGTLVAGTVGTWLFVVTFVLDGATRPGYHPVHHTVSALALGPRGWVQTTNFVLGGTLVATSAFGIHRVTSSVWLTGSVAVFGVALVASGVFRMDPMRGYPPGAPAGTPVATTRHHDLHDHAGAVVFAALPIAAVIAAVTVDAVVWSVLSAVTAVTFAVAAARFAAAWEADDPRTGLLQRLAIVPGWVWLGGLCWHLAVSS